MLMVNVSVPSTISPLRIETSMSAETVAVSSPGIVALIPLSAVKSEVARAVPSAVLTITVIALLVGLLLTTLNFNGVEPSAMVPEVTGSIESVALSSFVIVSECDGVDPLDTCAAIPLGVKLLR